VTPELSDNQQKWQAGRQAVWAQELRTLAQTGSYSFFVGSATNSAAELSKLIEAANSVCERNGNKPELVVLRRLSVS
jgi:hypothetical protein